MVVAKHTNQPSDPELHCESNPYVETGAEASAARVVALPRRPLVPFIGGADSDPLGEFEKDRVCSVGDGYHRQSLPSLAAIFRRRGLAPVFHRVDFSAVSHSREASFFDLGSDSLAMRKDTSESVVLGAVA